jgi:ribosomal protein S14
MRRFGFEQNKVIRSDKCRSGGHARGALSNAQLSRQQQRPVAPE